MIVSHHVETFNSENETYIVSKEMNTCSLMNVSISQNTFANIVFNSQINEFFFTEILNPENEDFVYFEIDEYFSTDECFHITKTFHTSCV